jgi:hypothetical protein
MMPVRRWILIDRSRTDSENLSDLTSGTPLSGSISFFPARAKRFLGWPVRVSFELGPASLDSVRFDFIYFPLVFELIQIGFRYDFQTLIPRVLQILF